MTCAIERGRGERENFVALEIEANGFLYNMVRTIVGTLVDVGRGARPESWPGEVLRAMDRRRAGRTAPPQGLFLVNVEYPDMRIAHIITRLILGGAQENVVLCCEDLASRLRRRRALDYRPGAGAGRQLARSGQGRGGAAGDHSFLAAGRFIPGATWLRTARSARRCGSSIPTSFIPTVPKAESWAAPPRGNWAFPPSSIPCTAPRSIPTKARGQDLSSAAANGGPRSDAIASSAWPMP